MISRTVRYALAAVVLGMAGSASAQSITSLGTLENGTVSMASGISSDGSVVVGFCDTPSGRRAVRWDTANGMQDLGVLPGGTSATSTGVSADGTVIVGLSIMSGSARAFRWSASGGMQDLGHLPGGTESFATGVSEDGQVVVGASTVGGRYRGFLWTVAAGMQDLGLLTGSPDFIPNAVSANGLVVVGSGFDSWKSGYPRAAKWTAATGLQELWGSSAYDVTSDGSVIVGYGYSDSGQYERAVFWGNGGIAPRFLSVLPDLYPSSVAYGVSADGKTIVGQSGGGSEDRAFVWRSKEGMLDLASHLANLGVDMTGWKLTRARKASSDGRFIVGEGTYKGNRRGFLAVIPNVPPCVGDVVVDWTVEGKDLASVLAAWGGCDPTVPCSADISGDGEVDGVDLAGVLASWGPCLTVPSWATLIEYVPDPAVVTDAALRASIISTGLPWRVVDTATQIEMVLIPPGTFQMGCSRSILNECWQGESPLHTVTLTQPFYMGRYEVTQAQWTAQMGSNPSYFQSPSAQVPASAVPNRPVERVSWDSIQVFLSATGMRLPTEAQWEYAYRAGTTTAFHSMPGYPNGTDDDNQLGTIAWFNTSAVGQTRQVGQLAANGFGLHDMSGNAWEWVSDWYGPYSSSAQTDPLGPNSGLWRGLRGGSVYSVLNHCRSSFRTFKEPGNETELNGFRVVRNP
jgi:probable HAF family extracellular repeat protein